MFSFVMFFSIFAQETVCFNNDPLNYTFPLHCDFPLAISSGLLDSDSLPDIVYAAADTILIEKGLGNGRFSLMRTFINSSGVPISIECTDMDLSESVYRCY
jgi:hypothetical protein